MRLRDPRARVGVVLVASLIAVAAALAAGFTLAPAPGSSISRQVSGPYTDAQGDELRRQTCTKCHNLPPPDVLPKARWRETVARMWLRHEDWPATLESQAAHLPVPDDFARIARWYTEHAPETLPPAEPWPAEGLNTPKFRKHSFSPPRQQPPAVSHLQFVDVEGDKRSELLVTDMRYGLVLKIRPYEPPAGVQTLAELSNPAHVAVADLDTDGIKDLLVADLGDFLPSDHTKGAVVWLRGRRDGSFQPSKIEGLPRVADVEAADMNGDGRLDLLVAAFGFRKLGGTLLFVNKKTDTGEPSFEPQTIDPRAGAIHVVPTDLDRDGRMDLIALVAQHHERVLAFYNKGTGAQFTAETLYAAPHPNWGSSGIQLTDLDRDGDLDLLLTHGDTLDDDLLKPYHGIQWLENTGGFKMQEHKICAMPGVHRAIAADLDGDGDQDILASSMIAFDAEVAVRELASIAWLEAVGRGKYVKRTLEKGLHRHATLDAADSDGDGDIDLAVGNMSTATVPWVEVWENLSIDKVAVRQPPPTPGVPRLHR